MKAISIKEPWATMIHCGMKTIETRTWDTPYRGLIVLCVSQNPKTLHSGLAIGIMYLGRIDPMEERHEERACCKVYPNAKAWIILRYRPFARPFKVKGKLGFFKVDERLIDSAGLKK